MTTEFGSLCVIDDCLNEQEEGSEYCLQHRGAEATLGARLQVLTNELVRHHLNRESGLQAIPIGLTVGALKGSTVGPDGPDDVVLLAIVGVCDRNTVRNDVVRELDATLVKLDNPSPSK